MQKDQRNFPGGARLVSRIIGGGGNYLPPGLGVLAAGQYFGSDQDTLYLEGDQHLNVIDAPSSQLFYQWP
jgi:hypothetical protein